MLVNIMFMKIKSKTELLLISALIMPALFICSCEKDDDGRTSIDLNDCLTELEEESAEGVDVMNFTYKSDNYTENDGKVTATKTAQYATEEVFGGAFSDSCPSSGDFTADLKMTFDSASSGGGILFKAAESDAYDGFSGYAFMLRDRRVYLYEVKGTAKSGMVFEVMADRVVERPKTGEEIMLRLERQGNTYRMYYLDDMEGVEPWCEFEYVLPGQDCSIGYADNGQGVQFESLSVSETVFPDKEGATYKNPVFGEFQAADPGVLKYDGKYYCYSTSAPLGYYVYVSDDLVKWENKGLCLESAWGIEKSGFYWAPEVIEKDGRFYMIMSVDERLGFAAADSPLGPFVPEKRWVFDKSIDGHIFIDDDGQAYLYYVSWRDGHEYGIYGCELEGDIVTVKPETEKLILKPESSWEKVEGNVTEGPFILKHNGKYYLTYSGTGYTSQQYAVGYAVSDSPLEGYERYEANPILSHTSKLAGPGHHSFTLSPNGEELIIVYHVHASTSEVHPRKICIDRARFAPTESGVDRLEIYGPTYTSQEYPK